MSVLIRGMEMPADCGHCRFAVDGWCYAYGKPNIDALANEGHTNFCPLVPVPPHGDLTDRDAYRDEFMSGVYDLCDDDPDNCRANAIIDLFDSAPTVIPAEPPKEEVEA